MEVCGIDIRKHEILSGGKKHRDRKQTLKKKKKKKLSAAHYVDFFYLINLFREKTLHIQFLP